MIKILIYHFLGSGKTGAFVIPILQRFAMAARADQSSRVGCTRVLVLLPTRELCVQVFAVFKKLSADIDNCEVACAAGGLDLQQQTAALRRDPDILGMDLFWEFLLVL